MSNYNISPALNKNKVFLVNLSELLGRLDPAYNIAIRNSDLRTKYPTEQIGKLVRSFSGGTPSKANPEFWEGNILWASPKDFKEFYLTDTEDRISESALSDSSTTLAPANSLLIVVRSGVLIHTIPVAIAKLPMAINQDLKALIPDERILPEYLGIYFRIYNDKLLPLIVKHSTTVQSINTEQFSKLKIPIPPKNIQQQIIAVYVESLQIKKKNEAAAEKLLASIDDYLLKELGITLPASIENSLTNRIFTSTLKSISTNRFDPFFHQSKFIANINAIRNGKYPAKPLLEIISENLIKGTLPRQEEKEGKNPVVQINCITSDGTITLADLLTAKDIFTNEQKLKIGDVLVVITGATIGKIAQWNYEGEYFLGGDIVKFQTNSLADNSFVFHFLRSAPMQTEIKRNITGATNGHMGPDDIKHLPIPIPPIEKQKEIADHITGIRQQAQQLKEKTKEALSKASQEIEKILLA
jgi:restriction endonuclease S subunit